MTTPPTSRVALPAAGHSGRRRSDRSARWVWLPVLLIAFYYGLPAFLALDRPVGVIVVAAGAIGCLAVTQRHHRPRIGLAVAITCLLVSPAALGGVAGLIASRARHLRRQGDLRELCAWVAAAVAAKIGQLAFPVDGDRWRPVSTVELTISVSMIGFALLAGLLVRSSARSTAAEQSAEQARAAEIRLEERARIAREMHDVVAHRISLVAMTSGALVYRNDLPPDAHEAATIIRSNARLALTELRAVLSDLRTSPEDGWSATPETPQPTLAQLPVLIAEARGAVDVKLTCDIDTTEVPGTMSRQLFRIVQEGLTNVRKHAPGQPVSVRIERAGGDVVVQVRNPMVDGIPATDDLRGSRGGYGLVGIQERARLLDGAADVEIIDGRFVLTVRVPAKLTA